MAVDCAHDGDACDAQLWGFMQTVFDAEAREGILQYIGFDKDQIAEKAKAFEQGVGVPELSLAESKAAPSMTYDQGSRRFRE